MDKKNIEVTIGGKVLTISGQESEDYMLRVAAYINSKINECHTIEGFKRQPADSQNLIIQLNLADDYFKAKAQIEENEKELAAKDREIYDLKHELVASQMRMESAERNARAKMSGH